MRAVASEPSPLYLRVAEAIQLQLRAGSLRVGDRAPSLRRLRRQHRVSMSTAIQAYRWLEEKGYLEARPKSGFFVSAPRPDPIPEPQFNTQKLVARPRGTGDIFMEVIRAVGDPVNVPLGAGSISPEILPNRQLNRILRQTVAVDPFHSASYSMPPGLPALRRQIARRSGDMGCNLAPDDITITSGALEAVQLALRATLKPGQALAVESPTYYGVLECAALLGLEVIEIPTHPKHGMDLDELARAIRRRDVRACFVMTNCHNPLGYVLPDAYKKALVGLTAKHEVALIEDDIYGDLAFGAGRPVTTKAFDRDGGVVLCSSYSKILAPGFRVGWIAAGRFAPKVNRHKMATSVAVASLPQMVIAQFLESGGYDRHVRQLRERLSRQLERVRQGVARYFPPETRVSRPAGGHLLWVELPKKTDAVRLYHEALSGRITVLPGPMFTLTRRYQDFVRLNCGHVWSEAHERALVTLGRLCERTR